MVQVQTEGSVTRSWCLDKLDVGHDTASRLLSDLVDLGLLVRRGAGRGTRYELSVGGAK